MPDVFAIIGQAWGFYRKQPVLNEVLFWLLALPLAGMGIVQGFQEQYFPWSELWQTPELRFVGLLFLVVQLALSIVSLWGIACVLVVGKKLFKNSAGRTRSSFKTVRKQAAKYVVNLFLTNILRTCFIFLWSLLLIVPGIIYGVRTAFYRITIICEGKGYRKSLHASKNVVRGHTWSAFLYLLGLGIVLFVPTLFAAGFIAGLILTFDNRLLVPVHILSGGLWGIATLVFTLATVILYAELKKLPRHIK